MKKASSTSLALPVGAPDKGTSEQIAVATGQVCLTRSRESRPAGCPSGQATQPAPAGSCSDDAVMGAQLTEQYQRAVGAMTEILRFGAMMMMLRDHIDSTRGVDRSGGAKKGAKYDKGTGLKAWLKEHAPEVKEATAFRFMNVALAVSEKFELPKKVSFIDLASKPADELPKKLQKKQMELWDFVNGTSQRSWLDQFTPKGGHRERPNGTKRRTKVEKDFDDKAGQARDWYRSAFGTFVFAYKSPEETWMHGDDVSIANLADVLKRMSKEVDDVCRTRKIVPSKVANWFEALEEKI